MRRIPGIGAKAALLAIAATLALYGDNPGPAAVAAEAPAAAAAGVSTATETPTVAEAPAAAIRVSTMEGYVSRYQPGHIGSGEAWDLMESGGDAVLLDMQSQASFEERHVSGAVNVPFEDLEGFAAANISDKSRVVICYCFCGDKGGTGLSARDLLTELGYANVYYMEPGDEWAYEGTLAGEPGAGGSVADGPDAGGSVADGPDAGEPGYRIVTGDEAKAIFDSNPAAVLLDVRNQDEYDEKHIGGSTLIPVSELGARLSELPEDKGAAIIVYCKAGARSKTAYGALRAAGYSNVYDMQSVDNWPEPLSATD